MTYTNIKNTSVKFADSPDLQCRLITEATLDELSIVQPSDIASGKLVANLLRFIDSPDVDLKPINDKITILQNTKVDKVTGKVLSTNDYTTAEKTKLAGLSNYNDTAIRTLITELTARVTKLETP